MSRIVLVHGDSHVDLPVGQDVGWSPLLAIAGVEDEFAAGRDMRRRGDRRSSAPAPDLEGDVVEFLLCGSDNPGNVLGCIWNAREALRSARSAIPREVWECCNDLWSELKDHCRGPMSRHDRVRWLRLAIADCERLNGALWATMERHAALAFTRIGQHLERAVITCRVLSVRADSLVATSPLDLYEQVRSMAVLRSLAAYEPFRRASPVRAHSGSILRFLLEDESFPRTVAACLSRIRDHLKDLPHNEEALSACTDTSVRVADARVVGMSAAELREFVDRLEGSITGLHHQIESRYFHGAMRTTESAQSPAPDSVGLARPRRPVGQSPGEPVTTYRVLHRTTYRYEAPAEQSYNEAHLRPRNTDHQRRVSHQLIIDPAPELSSEYVDLLGNEVSTFLVRGEFDELSVTSTSEVELVARPEPPQGPPWESVRTLLDIDRQPASRAARTFRAPSRLVPVITPLTEYAMQSFAKNRPVVDAVTDLCGRIHQDFSYEAGLTSVTTPLLEVFQERRGVCQDFAHLAVACLRAVGLAARYVSGYIESTASAGTALIGTEASHAWASTYLPGWGWVDLDPTNDQLVSDGHVTTAWGRDYWDVSPLRGSVVGGGRNHSLDVAVEMTRVESSAHPTWLVVGA
jgi:transglutaminase-like putative cysteine protease/uncharacterized alpha-E superfamily protein